MMSLKNRQTPFGNMSQEILILAEKRRVVGIEMYAFAGCAAFDYALCHAILQWHDSIRAWDPNINFFSVDNIKQAADVLLLGNRVIAINGIRHAPAGTSGQYADVNTNHSMATIMKLACKRQTPGCPNTGD
jgi:hypothetical protein